MIEVYTVDKCPKCTIIKGLLNKKEVAYKEVKLVTQEEKQNFIDKFQVRTMPYVVADGVVIGDAKVAADWIQKTYGA